jgi:clan AA aspartic protease (TIGR02281 family)
MERINLILTFLSIFTFSTSYSQIKIKLEKSNGVYYVPCNVNGLALKFIFDSGASDVTISLTEAIFMLKNNYLNEDNILGSNYYQIANGQIQEGTKIIINSIIIGGLEIKDVEASIVHNLKAPLLLGQSALNKLGNYTFDYSKNELIINNEIENNKVDLNCIKGDCNNGYGTYIYLNKDKYTGEFRSNKRNGFGTYIFQNGEKYEGSFIDDMFNGRGIYYYLNKDKYIGGFKKNKRNGYGTYIYMNGTKEEGFFKDDVYVDYKDSDFNIDDFVLDLTNPLDLDLPNACALLSPYTVKKMLNTNSDVMIAYSGRHCASHSGDTVPVILMMLCQSFW